MRQIFRLFSLLLFLSSTLCNIEVDVSWDFNTNDDLGGWGSASSEEMNMQVKAVNGELSCTIFGKSPRIDSPRLFVNVTRRHYVVMRARYDGTAQNARLLMRSGPEPSPREQSIFSKAYWTQRQPMIAVSDSGVASSNHTRAMAVDEDPYTYYLSSTPSAASLVFDLSTYRWITAIRILPIGDTNTPKRCLLQQSRTSGIGPFETVKAFTLSFCGVDNFACSTPNFTDEVQRFSGFSGYARYWRLVMVDNHGGEGIGIREVYLDGYDERVTPIPFVLDNSGQYKEYYLPSYSYLSGMLLRMRLEILFTENEENNPNKAGSALREGFFIDFFRLVRAPEIWKVRGCLEKYYASRNYGNPLYNVTSQLETINGNLPLRSYTKNNLSFQFATTYNCPLEGGIPILLEGINFGDNPVITIGGNDCPVQSVTYSTVEGRVQEVICTLPASSQLVDPSVSATAVVRVENSIHPGLFHEVPSLEYRQAPPVPTRPIITNIGARKVDLIWEPPGDEFQQMTVTGYKILWFQPTFRSRVSNITVGNITTTSIRGLEPATEYVFAIAAMNEGRQNAVLPTDLYGRRDPKPEALIGAFSTFTNATGTLHFDFNFQFFNSNRTLNSSSVPGATNTLGPTGQFASEGSYGLVLVGSANVQNCNVSSTCCDGYNATIGVSSCGDYQSVCAVLPAFSLAYDQVLGGVTRRGVPTNLPYENGAPADISIITVEELIANKGADLPSSACGPALRLTPSAARHSGAAWYRRKMNVREGFDTSIKFEISNPSQKCDRLDDVNTYCRSRGADGFAFVLQNVAPNALGNAGSGLGYEGIFNALSVELDNFHNFEQMDYYENHISVQTQGFRFNITANHSRSLATSNRVPDLTDGIHTVRIKYEPIFDESAVLHPSFQVNGFTTWFLNNADFTNGGEGDWGVGFGLLYVYLDDMYSPIITTPINLAKTIDLEDGRSYVGLTSATGDEYWQAHDILSWQFSSLYIDELYTPPLRLNDQDEGAYACVNETVCVHPVDYDHFTRTNNIWGKGSDSTEGWQDGNEGFCAFC